MIRPIHLFDLPEELLRQVVSMGGNPSARATNKAFLSMQRDFDRQMLNGYLAGSHIVQFINTLPFDLMKDDSYGQRLRTIQQIHQRIVAPAKNLGYTTIDGYPVVSRLSSILSAQQLDQLAKTVLDENLVIFFNKASYDLNWNAPILSEIQEIKMIEDKSEQANAIRLWMKDHSLLLSEVQSLHLHKAGLTHLPAEIRYFTGLHSLRLNKNKLSFLCNEIQYLTQLQELSLTENQLFTLPEEIGDLPNLQRLFLSHNRLHSLPQSIGNLHLLRILHISFNRLVLLPEEFGLLANLETFYIRHNRLTSLPSAFWDLLHLRLIDLSHNQLPSLSLDLIAKLVNLQSLNVHNNKFSFSLNISNANIGFLQDLQEKLTEASISGSDSERDS